MASTMLKKMSLRIFSATILALSITSCQGETIEHERDTTSKTDSVAKTASLEGESKKAAVTVSQNECSKTPEGVADLPYAHGKVFSTLDEYLAHLKGLSAIDLPYWREIRPGIYERVTHMPEATAPKTATREELMKMYCFDGDE